MTNEIRRENTEQQHQGQPQKAASAKGLIVMTVIFAILIGLIVAAGPIRKMIMG